MLSGCTIFPERCCLSDEVQITADERMRAEHMFRRIFGDDYGTVLATQLGEGDFNLVLMCRIAPSVWEFSAPELKVKLLVAIAVCAAVHQDVRYFVRAAIHHGVTRAEVEGTLLLAGLEGGFPAAGVARRLVDQGYEDHQEFMSSIGKTTPVW